MIPSRFPLAAFLPIVGALAYSCAEPSFKNPTPGQSSADGSGGGGTVAGPKPVLCELELTPEPALGGAAGAGGAGGMGGSMSEDTAPAVGGDFIDAPAGSPVANFGHLSVEGAQLVSECGSPVQLKGISSHWLNWENDGYALSLSGLRFMRDEWGLEIIRAAMGVEAGSGYLSNRVNMVRQVERIIENAVELGVYVIVDFHTHNAEQYEDSAITFFSDLSARYGHLPNVLFEPYNEPLDVSWDTVLKPYHSAVLAAIRKNDPDDRENVVILGTPNWDQDIDDVIGNELEGTNLMYTVHFYSCSHGAPYLSRAQRAYTAGIPIFVTEWGATDADGGVNGTPVCATQADAWINWMAQAQVGWTAWKLDNCNWEFEQNGVEDTSCILKVDAPVDGPWPEDELNGHAPYVVSKMKQ